MFRLKVAVQESVIDLFFTEVFIEDFEYVVWGDTSLGYFPVRQLGLSLYGKVPLNVVNGDPKYADSSKLVWVRIPEPIGEDKYREGYEVLCARAGKKPVVETVGYPRCRERIEEYCFRYDLTKKELEAFLLLEGYKLPTIRRNIKSLLAGGWITLYDHHCEEQKLVMLPADVEDSFTP